MKKLLLLLGLVFSFSSMAQDMIVTKAGEVISGYNLEVSETAIFYNVGESPDSELKRIPRSNILIIQKKDGTRLDVNTVDTPVPAAAAEKKEISMTEGLLPEEQSANAAAISRYNDNMPKSKEKEAGKKCNMYFATFGITEGSQITNDDLSINFGTGADFGGTYPEDVNFKRYTLSCVSRAGNVPVKNISLFVTLTNNGDRTIYIDLANTFILRNKLAEPYYIPSAKGSTNVTSTGAGIGFGIVSVGSSSAAASTQVTYSQRIITLPAHSSIDLDPHALLPEDQHIGDLVKNSKSINGRYQVMFNLDKIYGISELISGRLYEFDKSVQPFTFGFTLTYSFDESLSMTKAMPSTFYLKQIVATGNENAWVYMMKANMLTDNWLETITFPCEEYK